MLIIKNVTLRNFLSCGNVTQTVELNKNGLSLVLGENLDLGGNGSRNGVGKSTILQAISFGLYGESLTNIKKDNLINKINGKNMYVSIDFETNGHAYRIERGRKPTVFKYIVDNKNLAETATDEAQGETKDSQKEINEILGMSHTMFKHIVALNTYTEPFLSLGAAKQREIIEELLGITLLSQKAENLKEKIKITKTAIEQEEFRIKTIKQSNERIKSTLDDIERKSSIWENKKQQTIKELSDAIASLDVLDIDSELQSHKNNEVYNELVKTKTQLEKDIALKTRHYNQISQQLSHTADAYAQASSKICPTCQQGLHDHKHESIKTELEAKLVKLDEQAKVEQGEITTNQQDLEQVLLALQTVNKSTTVYGSYEEALNHRNTVETLKKEHERELQSVNPYADQKASINDTIQEVTYDDLNSLAKDKEHQEFLLKLLTNKDSFIRKKIIDQNLAYLNSRLNDYLDKLGLPHQIKFLNDLSVEITLLGQDLDFDNLSRGERTRLILGLSWAFRDIFENTNHAINLVFVDELLDSGMDPQGLEGSVEVLKKMERERNKNIFVISHREELINRVSNVLSVVKQNGFTTFDWNHPVAV
jgi:DNA repair exonuclease SbcCD ATPase subunit